MDSADDRDKQMRQYAPFPHELDDLVGRSRYRPGWTFKLADVERDPADTHGAAAGGLTLMILAAVHDAYEPDQPRPVWHYFPVPAATYDRRSWQRWLLERCLDVERHEACEWFQVVHMPSYLAQDGKRHEVVERPFAPNHGPGRDPYTVFEYSTDEDRRTSFQGKITDDEVE
jgi:hypothetical protein